MSIEITLPQLGDDVSAVTIERYYKQVGDTVEPGDPLAVIRNDRFEWDVPATAAGTIEDILAQPGATVSVGAALVRLRGAADAPAPTLTPTNGRVARATPAARKIAAVHGLDLAVVRGSGHGGTITRVDVLMMVGEGPGPVPATESAFNSCFPLNLPTQATITAPQPAPVSAPATATRRTPDSRQPTHQPQKATPQMLPFNAIQQAMAAQLVQSKTGIPHALTAVEVELSQVMAYIAAHRTRFAKRGSALNPMICIAHAAIEMLAHHRLVNSVWSDEGIIVRSRIQLGVVTGESTSGTAALIPQAADLSLQGLARALSSRTQGESNTLEPLNDATFTICDDGGARWRHAIISAYQGAALTIGAIERRPFVLEGPSGDTIVIRPLAILTLAYDARLLAQPQADAFLTDLKFRLEHFSPL